MLEFAAAALKSIVANGALAWSEAQDTIEDEDTTEDAKDAAQDGANEEGRACRAGPELRGVQDCCGTQASERTDAKFGAKFGAGRSFTDRACFFAALR